MEENVDPLGTLAQMDQAAEALVNLAPLLGRYFKSLQKEGFLRDEAFALLRDFQLRLIPQQKQSSREEQT